MPSNFTENYSLSQWERTDQVRMEDFNADNAKLDAALKAEAEARSALAATVARKGNCRIVCQTYTGDGSSTRTFTFPGKPLIVFFGNIGVEFLVVVNGASRGNINFNNTHYIEVSWSGNSVTLGSGAMNASNIAHKAIALIATD